MNNMLEVVNLCKDYGRVKEKKDGSAFAVKNVSFAIPEGYIMGFIGPNGAGKTTVIKTILQIKKQDEGQVQFSGSNSDIGVVLDTLHFPGRWTLAQVEQALSPFYKNWNRKKYKDYLDKFNLDGRKYNMVNELSRGMQVKLQIAIALSHDAKLLILDEPTSGLDPVARDEVCEILREFIMDGKKSVLFSTHITSDLEKAADYITLILNGEIYYTGTKDGLIEKYKRITGGAGEITDEEKKLVIGFRNHGVGFEGLIETISVPKLPKTILSEPASLEEIIVFLNKEHKTQGGE